jgi:hypothetical protein
MARPFLPEFKGFHIESFEKCDPYVIPARAGIKSHLKHWIPRQVRNDRKVIYYEFKAFTSAAVREMLSG